MGRFSKKRQADEDEASTDREVIKPNKKTKTDTATAETSLGKDNEGNSYWALGTTRRAVVQEFKGKTFINIREYYDDKGTLKPGKKGIMLTLEQYDALLTAIPAINSELLSKGHEVPDISASTSVIHASEQSTKSPSSEKKQAKNKKMNIEATSDEEEEEED